LLYVFGQPTQCVDQLHLLDRIAAGAKKKGRTDEISQALRVGDCCVEAIPGKKKCEIARSIFAARSCIETLWSLLALKFIENQSV
jgi:hypothetical protein